MDVDCTCPPDDCERLVRLAVEGDEGARRLLHDRFAGVVRRTVRYRLGQGRAGDWDDACQEIFLRVFRKLDTWQGRGKFCHWLKVLACRQAISVRLRLDAQRDVLALEGVEVADRRALDPWTRECLETTLATFPAAWQEALRLRSHGTSVGETSRALGVSERTVKKWIAAMYGRLSECLPG